MVFIMMGSHRLEGTFLQRAAGASAGRGRCGRLARGIPIERLASDAPVDGASPYSLAVTIHQFDANQYVRREATADFSAALTERATGREVWRDRQRAYNVDGGFLSLNVGIAASPEDLRRVALQTMSEAVDALLDKPGFRAALRR